MSRISTPCGYINKCNPFASAPYKALKRAIGRTISPNEIGLVNTSKFTGFVVIRDLRFQKERMFMHYLRGFWFLYRFSLLVQVRVLWFLEGFTCTHRNFRNRSHAICWTYIVGKFLSQNCVIASILHFTLILSRSLHFLVCIGLSSIYLWKVKYMDAINNSFVSIWNLLKPISSLLRSLQFL